jgi:hypothetical protein
MANPVWVLSVDLQTKTATFQSGMADAARSARGAFTDIKGGATEMGEHVSTNMFASRHAIMAVSEAFGDTMPRAITALLVHIGPLGAALEAAFPYAAIALAAVLIIEHFAKMREEAEKMARDQVDFGTAVQNSFNALDQKMLQAEIRADELRNDHLGALKKQLQLIDDQSMGELVHSFETVAKAAEVVFGDMQSHWYSFGIGSSGAKHALDNFKSSYDALLARGMTGDASDLLKGTKESAEKILSMQQQAKAAMEGQTGKAGTDIADQIKYSAAMAELKKAGVGYTEKEVESQKALVDALQAQAGIESKIAELKKLEQSNATVETHQKIDKEDAEKRKAALEAEKRASEEAKRFYEEAYRGYVQVVDQGEKETIAATKEGSAARLEAIDAAIKEEQTEQLTGTAYYRELLTARVNLVRQMGEEEGRLKAEAARESADNDLKMGELALAHAKEQAALRDSGRRVSEQQRLAEQINFANQELALKLTAMSQEMAALDKNGKDYENKLKALQDKQKQLVQAHENEITEIQDKAAMDRHAKILAAEDKYESEIASGLTSVIMGQKSFASMMSTLANQVATDMIQAAIKHVEANLMTKQSDAAAAARSAYVQGEALPGIGFVAGPVMAAAAYAGAMAYNAGTDYVPGVGRGDVVPAMLTPGEGVVPGGVMDGLRKMVASGNMNGGTTMHIHMRPTYHLQALDHAGMDRVLAKHSTQLQKHFQNSIRKLNR